MRAFLLSLDAIFAISLLLSLTIFLSGLAFTYRSPELTYQRLYYIGKDTVNVMEEAKLRDLQDFQTVEHYISEGIFTEKDMDKTLLDAVGFLWSSDNTTLQGYANDMLTEIFNATIPEKFGYSILMDGNVINQRADGDFDFLARLSTIASGYELGKPVSGYVARAWAMDIHKNNTLIVMGDVITSSVRKPAAGNNKNKVNITYNINIPEDANISSAYAFVETAWWDNKFKVYINGQFVYESSGSGGSARLDDITPYLHPGNNTANIVSRFGSGGYEGGDDGATHFVVVYNTTQVHTIGELNRFYFQEVQSNCSVRYKKPIFVSGDITSMRARINLGETTEVQEVTLKFRWKGQEYLVGNKSPVSGVVEWNNTEIQNIVNSNGITYSELDSRYFWFIVDIDEYHSREDINYSRRIDPTDSYIHVDYTTGTPYSYIDITTEIPVHSYSDEDSIEDFYRYIRWDFNVSATVTPVDARWQYAWLYWSGTDPSQRAEANDIVLYNHDPSDPDSDPLIVEFARFGYTPETEPGAMVTGTNKFELNFSEGYSINPFNSLGALTILIRNNVGFGETFSNESLALEDAIERLNESLGEFVEAVNIVTNSSAVGRVPSLWGPARLEVRIWH